MIAIVIDTGKWWRRNKRRALPSSWDEVPQSRLLLCLQLLMANDREIALPYILQHLLQVKADMLAAMADDDLAALFYQLDWMRAEPTEKAMVASFAHNGVAYHFPSEKFGNGSAIEYPLADEFYTKFLQENDESALLKLTATLCREAKQSQEEIDRTGDIRKLLQSRSEVEARAKKLAGLPVQLQMVALLYFAGIKAMVHRVYGPVLFEQEEEEHEQATAKKSGTLFGWWGIYMDLAENITNLDKIYQMNFHTICMLLVKRRREAKERELQLRMQSKDWGGND